jgi:general secretion pathway protein D
MASRIALTVILTASVVFSCAPKKEVVKQAGPVQPEEEFRLPEAPRAEPEPVAKKPKPFKPVLLEEGREKYILLNFDDTDVRTIISTFSELLEVNYILTPGITGTVTIQSYRKFPVKDLFPVFQSILEINGLTAVKEGEFYKIVPIDTAKQQPLEVTKGKEPETRLDSTFITQLLPLEYVNASDISNILRSLMPRGTDIIVYEPANMLIVTALPKTLVKFMKIIEALDVTETESETVRTFVYYVENGDAAKLEKILSTVYSGGKSKSPSSAAARTSPVRRTTRTPASSAAPRALPGDIGEISITAYEDINGLIIKATPRAYLSLLEVLKKIDVPARQVLIEVLIAEVKLSDSFEFGLEWLVKSKSGDVYGLNLGGVPPYPRLRQQGGAD